eukprot:GHVS01094467.1.p1 GENE.GHVS01094467.1~~GHVS01094467.1.p1  ORF type:complete len:202 (-),score=34.67 GHVS01094467.1:475-1080(-)
MYMHWVRMKQQVGMVILAVWLSRFKTASSEATAADLARLNNNAYASVLTASTNWTSEMLHEVNDKIKTDTSAVLGNTDAIVSTVDPKKAVVQMVLNKRTLTRAANSVEVDAMVDQTKFFDASWVEKAKAIKGTDGGKDWTVTGVQTKVKSKDLDLTSNINDGMTESFYKGFADTAGTSISSMVGIVANKGVLALSSLVAFL